MSVFMELAMQMCEESEKINATGQVKFSQFVEYFSHKSSTSAAGVLTASGVGMNCLSMGQASTLGGGNNGMCEQEKLIEKAMKVESQLILAASYGHIGVINSLLGSEKAKQKYKEGQFRLS